MMDIKEIIKWFIPCFHILRINRSFSHKYSFKMLQLSCLCLFLFFNFSSGLVTRRSSDSDAFLYDKKDFVLDSQMEKNGTEERNLEDISTGRTFGRPFKKMMAGLLPIIFQMGAATTWAAIATIIGFKTLMVSLAILKLLLIAGAAKLGALFATKSYHGKEYGWSPGKDIHLHIHNDGHGYHQDIHHEDTHYGPWNRDGVQNGSENRPVGVVASPGFQPYAGPQTISTPYGNYIKLDEALNLQKREVRNQR